MNRFDMALLVCALIFSAGLFVAQRFIARPAAATVEIAMNGVALAELPLGGRTAYTAANGENFVEVIVEGGEAYVAAATCRDQLCVRRGRISASGQSIVCLPNRVAIVLTGDASDTPDAVLY